jgi:hypothetical protein
MQSHNLASRIPALYHFTDIRNLPGIRASNGLFPLATLRAHGIVVPAPGGNDWSRDADSARGMDHYVHLCFRRNHPMEHVARNDGRIGTSIFLEIDAAVLALQGTLFTPDVSNKAGVGVYTLTQAETMIDFEVLYSPTDWSNAAIQQRLQMAEKCEILVPHHIPLNLIRNMPHG